MSRTGRGNGHAVNENTTIEGDSRLTLHAAALESPMFEESWSAGSPLNWTEFIQRWEARRPATRRDNLVEFVEDADDRR